MAKRQKTPSPYWNPGVGEKQKARRKEKEKKIRMKKKEKKRQRKREKLSRERMSHGEMSVGSYNLLHLDPTQQEQAVPGKQLMRPPTTTLIASSEAVQPTSPSQPTPNASPEYNTISSTVIQPKSRSVDPILSRGDGRAASVSETCDQSDIPYAHTSPESPLLVIHKATTISLDNLVKDPDDSVTSLPIGDSRLSIDMSIAFSFLRAMEQKQTELCKKTDALEAELRRFKATSFKLDVAAIAKIEEVLDLTGSFCFDLGIAEYAFKYMLDEHHEDESFSVSKELDQLKTEVRKLLYAYDAAMRDSRVVISW